MVLAVKKITFIGAVLMLLIFTLSFETSVFPITLVIVSIAIVNSALTLLFTILPVAFVLCIRSRLDPVAIPLALAEFSMVLAFDFGRILLLVGLGCFLTLRENDFRPFTFFVIIFKLSLVESILGSFLS